MRKYIFFSTLIFITLASCNKDLSGLDVNKKAYSSVPALSLFTGAEKNLVDDYTSTSVGSAPFRVFSQEWTENTYLYEAQYNFAAYNPNAGWWNNLFRIALANFNEARKYYDRDIVDAGERRNDNIITDILEVYAFNMLVASYGPVPYSDAFNVSVPFPKYDDEKTIYTDLLKRLDTCIAGINTSNGNMGAADQIYKGDMTKWKKFAATLKLKIAILLADVDPTTAAQKVSEAISAGVFTSNADNASMTYQSSPTGNTSMLWQALVNSGRHDFCPANLLVNTMVAWNDPRLPLYFTKDKSGNYSGGVPGQGNNYGTYSDFSAQMLTTTYPGTILNYAQAEFLQAEAIERGFTGVSGTAAGHYNNAIGASIKFWGGSSTDSATYLSQPSVAYATATGSWKQKLGYQEWIANYNMNWDSWTDIRRLGFPNLNVVNPPVKAQGSFPLRYPYPSNESGSNATNWKAAVALLPGGQDVDSAKLYWMK